MIKGENQKAVYEILLKEGKVENLGRTYRAFANSPKRINNRTIENFIESVKELHPNATLIRGSRGGLDTAILKLN
ncbi:hypothetical protein [Clostridium botulinum]|uniref:hypothetical protein n=1 Tax=Clostridium botulinum TaxID=1491 RepID=UPI0004A57531|nr:hypothetical protein [Clostridium botulinum]KEI94967.1 hypothetical protein N496_18520 [Clostridium botulinum A2B3 87]MCC5422233.1 hypothetical protein [Clostridium botulinum]NCI20615.1 hypothetical protein [Clostridium botulinum]NCI35324.1 hypothetical protein [Clostridium botulinum]NCI72084.1 hypothetical protein [Clostridium botulinum]